MKVKGFVSYCSSQLSTVQPSNLPACNFQSLIGGLMCSRDTVVEAAKRCPNEPCSGGRARARSCPLVNYRASAESFLREIHEVAALRAKRPSTRRGGHRASAKQTLNALNEKDGKLAAEVLPRHVESLKSRVQMLGSRTCQWHRQDRWGKRHDIIVGR